MNAAKYPTWDWRKAAAKAMHAAQARPVTPAVTPRSSADALADLRTELKSVRMAVRMRAKVEALLDEIEEWNSAPLRQD